MKNILLILIFSFVSIEFIEAKTIYGNFVFDNQLVAYEFTQIDPAKNYFQLKFFKIQESSTSGTEPETKILENLTDLRLDIYKEAIKSLLTSLFPDASSLNDDVKMTQLCTSLFYELKNRMEFEDTRPVTGIMYLIKDEIKAYPYLDDAVENSNTNTDVQAEFKVKKVEIQFADGGFNNILIETIDVNETNPNNVTKFRNNIPISISGKFDPENFMKHKIFHDGASGTLDGSKNYFLKLNELIRYDIRLENNKEDYSPADTIITLTPNIFSAEVFKEKTSKVLSARTFTDLVGIDEQQPNGLIQIDIFRKFNLITSRKSLPKRTYTGGFTYIQPMFSLTKIEENNKFLPINEIPKIDESYTVNPIELLRYQQFNFGFDMNLGSFNIPNFKSKFFLDLHYDLGRTTLAFEESETSNILTKLNYSTYGPTLYYQILPDSRFGFKTGYDVRKQSVHANKVSLSSDQQVDLINDDLKWYGTYWFLGNFKTNPNSELFFRFRYHHRYKESESNLLQIQLGVSFDILRNK